MKIKIRPDDSSMVQDDDRTDPAGDRYAQVGARHSPQSSPPPPPSPPVLR